MANLIKPPCNEAIIRSAPDGRRIRLRCHSNGRRPVLDDLFPGDEVLGVGMAISSAPLTTTVMGAVESQYVGLSSGINNAVSRTAALVSVAVLSIVALSAFASGLDERLA